MLSGFFVVVDVTSDWTPLTIPPSYPARNDHRGGSESKDVDYNLPLILDLLTNPSVYLYLYNYSLIRANPQQCGDAKPRVRVVRIAELPK